MKIAVEGCCHGELDAIYRQIKTLEQRNGYKVDLLLICGDFQAIRNPQDLGCMSVPQKYKQLGGFHKYYTGETKVPILTIIIGGNHEASNYFWELYHGGWIAPNMYFLGHAGCVQVNGIRIAGSSGIFKASDFRQGHYEKLPYNPGSMRSIYHVREYNIRRLSLLSSPDIFLSHDWPASIEQHGDVAGLIRRKPFFRDDIRKGALGSPPLLGLLHTLKPSWWFSAHLHVRFEARVIHAVPATENEVVASGENPDEIVIDDDDFDNPSKLESAENADEIKIPLEDDDSDANINSTASNQVAAGVIDTSPEITTTSKIASITPKLDKDDGLSSATHGKANPDEIMLDDEEEEVEATITISNEGVAPEAGPGQPVGASRQETRFLALDKCLPRREYLEVIDYPALEGPATLSFDPEWLAITRAFNPLMSLTHSQPPFPSEAIAREMVRKESAWVQTNVFNSKGESTNTSVTLKDITDVQVFSTTAPGGNVGPRNGQPPLYPNPQTAAFCTMLQIENKIQ